MVMSQEVLVEGSPEPARVPLRELTEGELQGRFARLVLKAEDAFRQDPQYLVEMVQQASILVYKKALWRAKAASDEGVREAMEDAGVLIPMRGQRARRRSNSV
jgi:hypothetical protein